MEYPNHTKLQITLFLCQRMKIITTHTSRELRCVIFQNALAHKALIYNQQRIYHLVRACKTDGSIEDINDNIQDDVGAYVDERASRREFRKWENTKFISKILKKIGRLNHTMKDCGGSLLYQKNG